MWKWFIAGALLGPVVMKFGGLIVWLIGLITCVWIFLAAHKVFMEGYENGQR
jgi:hypothetical protein